MYSALIKKKGKVPSANKVESSELKGIEKYIPKEIEKTESPKMTSFGTANKVKPSEVPSAKSPSKADLVGIDALMESARKKPKNNAVSSEGEEFKVDKDDMGMWKETGADKEEYLKKIGKLKRK